MKTTKQNIYMLPLITLFSGLLIAFFYYALFHQIERTKTQKELKIKAAFFPRGEYFQKVDPFFEIVHDKEKNIIGYLLSTSDHSGYGGEVKFIVALDPDFMILDFQMTENQETPGLGSKVNDPQFRKAFKGIYPFPEYLPDNKKDFPDKLGINALSGATVTSLATIRALSAKADKYVHYVYQPMWDAVQKAFDQYEVENPTPYYIKIWRERRIQQELYELSQGVSQ